MAELVPTWGYAADGKAQLFQLASGEALPQGWADHPNKWKTPAVNQAVDELDKIIASQNKGALDRFAASQGIELDRRKSFGKMVADYREAISR